jgi:hypothetical protein
MYKASVSAAIDMVLFCEIVLVDESPPHARNADKNALWISFFSFALCQWPIPRIAFQLGSFPGTVSWIVIRIRSRWRGAGERRRALRARAANVVFAASVAQAGVGGERSHFAPTFDFFGADFRR